MVTKKLGQGKHSRLAEMTEQSATPILSTAAKKRLKPSGVRLSDESRADLQAIVKAVDSLSNSRITGSDIIRALIYHGSKKMKPNQVLQALKDSL